MWGTSVKYSCCKYDADDYNTNGATHDPAEDGAGTANGDASVANIAKQRMCPPPDAGVDGDSAQSQSRYGDAESYVTNTHGEYGKIDRDGDQACFHNRTLRSEIHFASIVDFYPEQAHRHNWNESDVNIPYLDPPDDAWVQEKHPESFYQLCVAERTKKVLCCDGESVAPCQRLSTGGTVDGNCRYPGYNTDPAKAHCGTNADNVTGEGCDCEQCAGAAIAGDTWTPRITPATNYSLCFLIQPQPAVPNPNTNPNPNPNQMNIFFSKKSS